MESTINPVSIQPYKNKVVFILGATGTGKSKLSIYLASHFGGEVINSDKIQVYKGLDIVTNKISEVESQGVKHHLLGTIDPELDFSADDFCLHALSAINNMTSNGKIPIIVGGSNTYIQKLVEDPKYKFTSNFDACFIWLHVELPVLKKFVSKRVDQMVESGLVDEIREVFVPRADYTRGIRRAIGVPEMEQYFMAETEVDNQKKKVLLKTAIQETKDNTIYLASKQMKKIEKLRHDHGWPIHSINATTVFENCDKDAHCAWKKLVRNRSLEIVAEFLQKS